MGCFSGTTVITNATSGNTNGTITVTANGGIAPYQYSIDGINFQASNIFTGLDTNLYTLVVKDALNTLSSTTATVINITGPGISLNSTTASCANTNGTIVINAIAGTTPYQYSIDSINFTVNNTFSNLSAGNYKAWIKDKNGCRTKDTITVSKLPLPYVFLGNDSSICVGDSLIISIPLTAQYKYLWKDGSTANQYLVRNAGAYFVNVTNQFNCSFSDTINISSKQLPAFSLGNDTAICTGKYLSLQVPLSNATYLWNTASNASGIIALQAGLYWVNVTQNGCHKRDSIVVFEKPAPFVYLGNDTTLCEGQTVQLNAGNNNSNYLWQDNTTNSTYLVSKAFQYIVIANKNNCLASDTVNIYFNPKPIFTLGFPQLICQGQSVLLEPAVNPHWLFQWQDGSNKPVYSVTQPGQYYLDATNTCGTTRKEVLFTSGLCQIYVPNAFSPNGDGVNDVFKVSGTELVTQFHLQIFNRYGQIVFETTEKSKGWNGTIKNQPVETGN